MAAVGLLLSAIVAMRARRRCVCDRSTCEQLRWFSLGVFRRMQPLPYLRDLLNLWRSPSIVRTLTEIWWRICGWCVHLRGSVSNVQALCACALGRHSCEKLLVRIRHPGPLPGLRSAAAAAALTPTSFARQYSAAFLTSSTVAARSIARASRGPGRCSGQGRAQAWWQASLGPWGARGGQGHAREAGTCTKRKPLDEGDDVMIRVQVHISFTDR